MPHNSRIISLKKPNFFILSNPKNVSIFISNNFMVLNLMDKMSNKKINTKEHTTFPCGCVYHDKGWLLTRVTECKYHKKRRTRKRPFRPKAECVRP